ncbi:AAA family ATPase [Armatimonas sp.]|uniref:AAA family ATPase n=1 Tax=Armatimonas sp. TaxID=1872638 RepID=UPI0037518567
MSNNFHKEENERVILLSYTEAAARAGVSEMTIRRRVEDGSLPKVRQGARSKVRLNDLQALYPEVATDSRTHTPKHPCRVIALANQKGGVGKTSTCANLAAALSSNSLVLAIDCDPQGNLTQALGPNPDTLEVTLYNVLVERVPLEKALLNPILNEPNLSLIGANLELASADHQLAGAVAREMRLRQVLEPLMTRFDYILIDCPPALGLLTLNALSVATEVIVPVDMGVFSLRGVAKLMDTISEIRSVNPELRRVRALSNRSDNTNLSLDVRGELKRAFGDDLFETSIRRSVKIGEAQAARTPITLYRAKDPAALDYFALAEEVRQANLEGGTPPVKGKQMPRKVQEVVDAA